jgi:hypothetical protein
MHQVVQHHVEEVAAGGLHLQAAVVTHVTTLHQLAAETAAAAAAAAAKASLQD